MLLFWLDQHTVLLYYSYYKRLFELNHLLYNICFSCVAQLFVFPKIKTCLILFVFLFVSIFIIVYPILSSHYGILFQSIKTQVIIDFIFFESSDLHNWQLVIFNHHGPWRFPLPCSFLYTLFYSFLLYTLALVEYTLK